MSFAVCMLMSLFLSFGANAEGGQRKAIPDAWTRTVDITLLASREAFQDFAYAGGGSGMPGFLGVHPFSSPIFAGSEKPDMWLLIVDEQQVYEYVTRPNERKSASRNPLQSIFQPALTMSMATCPDSDRCT